VGNESELCKTKYKSVFNRNFLWELNALCILLTGWTLVGLAAISSSWFVLHLNLRKLELTVLKFLLVVQFVILTNKQWYVWYRVQRILILISRGLERVHGIISVFAIILTLILYKSLASFYIL
jgi:hypothetical protein